MLHNTEIHLNCCFVRLEDHICSPADEFLFEKCLCWSSEAPGDKIYWIRTAPLESLPITPKEWARKGTVLKRIVFYYCENTLERACELAISSARQKAAAIIVTVPSKPNPRQFGKMMALLKQFCDFYGGQAVVSLCGVDAIESNKTLILASMFTTRIYRKEDGEMKLMTSLEKEE